MVETARELELVAGPEDGTELLPTPDRICGGEVLVDGQRRVGVCRDRRTLVRML